MSQYIDKDALVAEIERKKIPFKRDIEDGNYPTYLCALMDFEDFINTLEVKEVDLEKLGEIARHLIAVKEHIEDMRLDKEEWFMLEKIGYPERFKAQKGEDI